MFNRQRGRGKTISGSPAAMLDVFFTTIAFEISEYFTANVPPNPQHTARNRTFLQLEAVEGAEQRRGCAFTPSSRKSDSYRNRSR